MQIARSWEEALDVLKFDSGVGVELPADEHTGSISEWYYLSSIKSFDRWFSLTTNGAVLESLKTFLDGLFTRKHQKNILEEAELLLSQIQKFEGTHAGQTRVVRLKLEHGSSPENVPHVDYTTLALLQWTRGLRVFVGPRCMYCEDEHVKRAYAKQYNESQVRERLGEISADESNRLAGEAQLNIAPRDAFKSVHSDRILFKAGPKGMVHMAPDNWKGPRLTLLVNQVVKFIYGDEFD